MARNIDELNKSRTREERVEAAIKAGKASGKARRERKTLKEELLLLLETDDWQNRITTAMLVEAASGNTKAFELIRDTIGEKPKDKVDVTTNIEMVKNYNDLAKSLKKKKDEDGGI